MQEEIDFYFNESKGAMEDTIAHLQKELSKVRTGKANANIFDSVMVDYYGNPTPIRQVANIGTLDARTINIQPWEKKMIDPIERSIFEANLGLTPQNDGENIRITIPMLTEERRKNLVKQIKSLTEEAKVGIRNSRRELMDLLKKAVKDGYPEDMGKKAEAKAQQLTDEMGKKAEELADVKEKDIMTV